MTLLCEVRLATRLSWSQELFTEINYSVLTDYRGYVYRVLQCTTFFVTHSFRLFVVHLSVRAQLFKGIVCPKTKICHYLVTLIIPLKCLTTFFMPKEEDEKWVQDYCMQVGNAYIIVYSITDRSSFESASELRIQLRRIRQAENIPIILVGNKSDLVRSREVAVEEGRACAVVFDCKFIETSASLHHNVHELFEGIVRQIRLRRDSKEINERRRSIYKRKESITKTARRFLDRLVAKNNKKMALKVRSKSCHDLAVL
uniref:GTP-binding protein GEM-like n=2 Tax=Sinocyclocheilus grahami TaxID=75366 RepID=A0A672KCE5_SINGR